MPETKKKIQLPDGKMGEGFDVPIKESTERWSEIILEDGTTIRLKPNVLSVTRIEGQWDQNDNPMYAVFSNQMMTVVSTPAHLKKPASGGRAN